MRKILLTTLFVLALVGCSEDGSDSPTSNINLLSPKSSVNYNHVTLEVDDNVSNVKAKISGQEYPGIKGANSFFIHNVPLDSGTNKVELIANNGNDRLIVDINSNGNGTVPILLKLDETKGFGSLTTNAEIKSKDLIISSYIVDNDGDNVYGSENTSGTFELTYDTIGTYNPKITVRTSKNLLYTILSTNTVNIVEDPLVNAQSISDTTNIRDLEQYGDFTYALTDYYILKISQDDSPIIVERISVPGLIGAEGFSFDSAGNIFIADTANDRVTKLLAANNYLVDSSFILNRTGSGNGELLTPADVTISGVGNDIRVFVLDAGNNRIQMFNHVGAYLAQFNGSTTTDGELNSPLNMIGAPNLIITDSGNNIVRELTYNESTKTESSRILYTRDDFGKATYSSNGILIPNNTDNRFDFVDITGKITSKLPTTNNNLIAIAYELNHQLILVKDESSDIEHMFISKTAPQAAPKALTKQFVTAYLNNDDTTMLSLTSEENINKLKEIDAKVIESFNGMLSYNEHIYMNGFNAVVAGKSNVSVGDVTIKFYFSWANEAWSLTEIL